MKLSAAATAKLMGALTGREVFTILLNRYIELALHKAETFSESQCDQMLQNLRRRPLKWNQCGQWLEATDVILHALGEARRMAMEVVWRLSVMVEELPAIVQASAAEDIHRTIARISTQWQNTAPYLQGLVGRYAQIYLLVEVFGELHDCPLTDVMAWEDALLQQYIAGYNRCVFLQNHVNSVDPQKEVQTPLLLLLLNTHADLKPQLRNAITTSVATHKPWQILTALQAILL